MTGKEASLEEKLEDLSNKDVVFLGETHLDHETHRMEMELIRQLHSRHEAAGRPFIVSMEMFSRDVQNVLDRYLAGEMTETDFRENSNLWGNYDTGYRATVERAMTKVPVITPSLCGWRKVAWWVAGSSGRRGTIAKDLLPGTERYWERYDRTAVGMVCPIRISDRVEWSRVCGTTPWRAIYLQFKRSRRGNPVKGFHARKKAPFIAEIEKPALVVDRDIVRFDFLAAGHRSLPG